MIILKIKTQCGLIRYVLDGEVVGSNPTAAASYRQNKTIMSCYNKNVCIQI